VTSPVVFLETKRPNPTVMTYPRKKGILFRQEADAGVCRRSEDEEVTTGSPPPQERLGEAGALAQMHRRDINRLRGRVPA
jgi:hypothetical protein